MASASASLGNQVLSSVVELYLSCKNLPNMDTFSKSDPFVVVYVQSTITNNRAPKWTEASLVLHCQILYEFTTNYMETNDFVCIHLVRAN